MVTTIEWQAHKTELSEVVIVVHSHVPARTATLLIREGSPVVSEASFSSSSSSVWSNDNVASTVAPVGDNLPQNARTSSLLQMWRELEAEAGVMRTLCTLSGGMAASSLTNASDDSEASGDSEPEVTTVANNSSSMADSEKGRVGIIVMRMISFKGSTKFL
ncbi:uncharacterized protein M6B38_357000 [Iris pallida]|uniref:Uncharacterized protein n=1 Tax=Iris pallida TaxID=29817 RepID=A0AAX6G719_IRIPA|nr:uncharacterized protein M6B38_382070 [Iris pallida]KAJ6829934.1 uncharacterized protein M6B38_357000 [Iris pallida]